MKKTYPDSIHFLWFYGLLFINNYFRYNIPQIGRNDPCLASPRLNQLLVGTAKKLNIPFHVDVATRTFSDHNVAYQENPRMEATFMFVARSYTHSINEVADMANAERAVNVLHQAIAEMAGWDD